MKEEDKITYFAETDYRNKRTRFGIRALDRARHMYVVGKTGMGKSTLLKNMAIQDIQNGEGLAVIDPHGDFAECLLDYVPEDRVKDVVYFAPFDTDYPISFNVMESVDPDKRHLVASGLMSSFKKIWVDAWSARMEYILNNILLALLEYPSATILGVNRMLSDKEYRKIVVDNITDPSVKAFWTDEFAKYGERYMQEAGAAIQNKIGQFISNPLIRNIVGQPESSFDIRKIMDEKKILIMNLSKGRIGEQNASLLGGMLITKIYLGAMSRADKTPAELDKLPHFYFYVDEFQSFASDSFADILSEARKYKLNLTIAHQYIEQMSDAVKAAVFGNVGTMIVFRVGSTDAEIFEKEFAPYFLNEDIVNLGFAQIYLKLMINGIGSKPFSATTLPLISQLSNSYREQIINHSRGTNALLRGAVEDAIKAWHGPTIDEKKQKEYEERVAKRIAEGTSPEQTTVSAPAGAKSVAATPPRTPYPPRPQYAAPRPEMQYKRGDAPISATQPPIVPKEQAPHAPNTTPNIPPKSKPFTPKPNPSLNTKPKEPVFAPKPVSGPSPLLKDLLGAIEAETKKDIPMREVQKPNPIPEIKEIKSEPTQTFSLSSLKQSTDKSAGAEKVSALKEALSRATLSRVPKEEKPEPKIDEPMPEVTKKVKEIPEDVLRKILD